MKTELPNYFSRLNDIAFSSVCYYKHSTDSCLNKKHLTNIQSLMITFLQALQADSCKNTYTNMGTNMGSYPQEWLCFSESSEDDPNVKAFGKLTRTDDLVAGDLLLIDLNEATSKLNIQFKESIDSQVSVEGTLEEPHQRLEYKLKDGVCSEKWTSKTDGSSLEGRGAFAKGREGINPNFSFCEGQEDPWKPTPNPAIPSNFASNAVANAVVGAGLAAGIYFGYCTCQKVTEVYQKSSHSDLSAAARAQEEKKNNPS